MKKLILCVSFILLLCSVSFAASERIIDFHSDISINSDSSMLVTETIKVESTGDQIKRGIYRDFPTKYKDKYGTNYNVGFKIVKIERDGAWEDYHTEELSNGIRIYIGQSSYYLDPGIYTYKITYHTTRQLGFFKGYDELYWNVTGNGWAFPIEHASATITLPSGASILNTSAYTGYQGEKGADFSVSTDGGKAYFGTTVPLLSRQGLTVAVAWPKGFVPEPTRQEKIEYFLKDNLPFVTSGLGLALILLYYLLVWFMVGRDPKKGTIIPFFGPPQNISAAQMRIIMRMGFDNKCFVAAIVSMATKGYLKIEEDNGEYYIEGTKKEDQSLLTRDEEIIEKELIAPCSKILIDNVSHASIGNALDKFEKHLNKISQKIYFFSNIKFFVPGILLSIVVFFLLTLFSNLSEDLSITVFLGIWLSIWSFGVIALAKSCISSWREGSFSCAVASTLFALPFFIVEIVVIVILLYFGSAVLVFLIIILAVVNTLFFHLLKAPTLLGRRLMDQIEGFKLYLSTAEKDRLNFFNQPGKSPDLFEKFLPYAIALDVENQWAEYFSDEFNKAAVEGHAYSPSWYHGKNFASLGAAGLASSLGSSFSEAVLSASVPPGSSSSGRSGSFGGGSSGGGGGGGGGGGW